MSRPAQLSPEQLAKAKVDLVDALERRVRRRGAGDDPPRVTSTALARWIGVRAGGSTDSRKRGVRLIIKALREEDGVPIVADFRGYRLAVTPADHAAHAEFLRRMGIAHLVSARRTTTSPAAADAAGQHRLF